MFLSITQLLALAVKMCDKAARKASDKYENALNRSSILQKQVRAEIENAESADKERQTAERMRDKLIECQSGEAK